MRSYPVRKLQRKSGYDYSLVGAYFVTILVKNKSCFFGEISNEQTRKERMSSFRNPQPTNNLTEVGEMAKKCWKEIPNHYQDVRLDEFVIMPNHIHGILWRTKLLNGKERIPSFRKTQSINWHGAKSGSLSAIIRGFKIGITKWCRDNNYERFSWHKSFHDLIIRDEEALNRIREYIRMNPKIGKMMGVIL